MKQPGKPKQVHPRVKACPVAPRFKPPHNFYAHLEHLRIVLPNRLPEDDSRLYEVLGATLGRAGGRLGWRQFMDQLRGKTSYNPRLPDLLDANIPLSEFGIARNDWLKLRAFKSKLPKPSSIATSVQTLRTTLDQWAKESPAEHFSVLHSVLQLRRATSEDSEEVLRLQAGKHTAEYRLAGLPGETARILLLEHDEKLQEWLCLSAMQGFPSTDHERHNSGKFELKISSSPGICTLFIIGGKKSFDHGIQNIIGRIRRLISEGKQKDGAMDKQMTAQMLNLLSAERKATANGNVRARCVGCLRYQVF